MQKHTLKTLPCFLSAPRSQENLIPILYAYPGHRGEKNATVMFGIKFLQYWLSYTLHALLVTWREEAALMKTHLPVYGQKFKLWSLL